MANVVKHVDLSTREARSRLEKRKKPHWQPIDNGALHLGYFKGERGGSWIGRRYTSEGRYKEKTLGVADDQREADAVKILTYRQARKAAEIWEREAAETSRLEQLGPPLTVRKVVEEYHAARAKAGLPDSSYRLTKHLLTHPVADTLLVELKSTDLAAWLAGLAEGERPLKPATGARTATDLKAALNAARLAHPEQLRDGPAFQLMVRDGLKPRKAKAPVARRPQILSDDKLKAVDAASIEVDAEGGWEGDLRMMLAVLAATGTRFSQAARITVGDVQQAERRIMVPVSHKGKGGKAQSHTRCPVPAELIDLLKPALSGRDDDEILLLRPRWKQTGPATWVKIGRAPWLNASELSRPWDTIREKVGLSAEIVPYALRHSSIVRWLRKGKPVLWVAKLHDTSSEMIDSHYGAYILDADDEHAAQAVVPLLSAPAMPLRQAGAA